MTTNGKPDIRMPTTEMICAQALELADNMRTLAAQSQEEANRLSAYADGAANSIVEAVNRFSNQTTTLLTFIDKTTESCQVAINSIDVFAGTARAEAKLPSPAQKAISTGERR